MASRPVTTGLAAALWIACVAMTVGGLAIARDTPGALQWALELAPVSIAYATVGAVVGTRRPANPVGWIFGVWGLALSGLGIAESYVDSTLANGGAGPDVQWAAWVITVCWHPSFAFLAFQVLLFPHGHLPSPRWRHFARATVAVYVLLAISAAFSPSAIEVYEPGLDPPFTAPGGRIADVVFEYLLPFQILFVATSVVSLVLRLRRAGGRERQQIKGFVYAVVVAITTFIAGLVIFGEGVLFPAFGIIPIAAGVAILRRQLYDIDHVIARTVVYGVLTAMLALVYAGGVVALGQIFGQASDLAVAGSTLVVAAMFRPARRRVQQVVDRHFNRRRYDAARLASAFSQRCRDEVDLDTLAADLSAAVTQAMEPAHLALWWDPSASHNMGRSYREVEEASGTLRP